VTTKEDWRSGYQVTQEFTHHRSTLFHQTPTQRHPVHHVTRVEI
jgi:hypothetical protein